MDDLAALIRRRSTGSADSIFLEDARSDRVVRYGELGDSLAEWSGRLDALGIGRGGSVIVDIGDPLDFALVHLSVVAAGRRSVPVNPDLTGPELNRISGLLDGAPAVITDRDDRSVPGAAVLRIGSLDAYE